MCGVLPGGADLKSEPGARGRSTPAGRPYGHRGLVAVALLAALAPPLRAQEVVGSGRVYSVVEIPFTGPAFEPADAPARDVEFWVDLRHESGSPTYRIHGFWDGEDRFFIRFTPTSPGAWTLARVYSNRTALLGQKEGSRVVATPSDLHGFWEADPESPGRRWYRRSDGSHQYIVGNTFYSFLSETYVDGKPNGSDIATDVSGNAGYFNKLRFSAIGDLYPHASAAPFLDDDGEPTYDGDYSHRPNPEWFRDRTDLAVRTAFAHDLIADLIVAGVDTREARSALRPEHNDHDPAPFLRYIAARYGAYANVWLTLVNEADGRNPSFTSAQIIALGRTLGEFLPYPTPVSVHRNWGPWSSELNTEPSWNDRVIIQLKLRDLSESADAIGAAHRAGGGDKPVINDELSYQGAGDDHSRDDTIESHLGALLGGGYGTTGYKSGEKLGQYFAGDFDPAEHGAAPVLKWLREQVDEHVTFWRMEPVQPDRSIFTRPPQGSRAMQWPSREYLLGTDGAAEGIVADLPPGQWEVRRFDLIAGEETVLDRGLRGAHTFDAPASRAVLFHFRRTGD